jgi:hypothetical protein
LDKIASQKYEANESNPEESIPTSSSIYKEAKVTPI